MSSVARLLGTPGQNSIADRAGLCSDRPAGVQGAETDMDMAYVAAFLGGLLVFPLSIGAATVLAMTAAVAPG